MFVRKRLCPRSVRCSSVERPSPRINLDPGKSFSCTSTNLVHPPRPSRQARGIGDVYRFAPALAGGRRGAKPRSLTRWMRLGIGAGKLRSADHRTATLEWGIYREDAPRGSTTGRGRGSPSPRFSQRCNGVRGEGRLAARSGRNRKGCGAHPNACITLVRPAMIRP